MRRSIGILLLSAVALQPTNVSGADGRQVTAVPRPTEPTAAVTGPRPGIRTAGKTAFPVTRTRADRPAVGTETTGQSAAQGAPVLRKISGASMAGDVTAFAVSPDGTRAVYIADQQTPGRFELYSTPLDTVSAPVKLSAGLAFAGTQGVSDFQITRDSQNVVFSANPGTTSDGLYSVPLTGGTAVRLANGATTPVLAFGLPRAGSFVGIFADPPAAGGVELFAAQVGQPDTATQLSSVGASNSAGAVVSALFSPDGTKVVFAADPGVDNRFQWFSVPFAGGTVQQLSNAMSGVGLAEIDPTSAKVVYTADQNTANINEIYSVSIGGGTSLRLNSATPGNGVAAIEIGPLGDRVTYLADENTLDVFEVYSASLNTPGSSRLNTALISPQFASSIAVDPGGTTVVYEADATTVGTDDLYAAPLGGSGSPTPLTALGPPKSAGFFAGFGTPVYGSRVLYPVVGIDTQTLNVPTELYSVPFDGSAAPTRLNDDYPPYPTPPPDDTELRNVFLPGNGRRLMAFGIGPDPGNMTSVVSVVPVRRDAGLVQQDVNVPAPDGSLGVQGYEVAATELYAVWAQDQDTIGKIELYSRELDPDNDNLAGPADNCPFVANPTLAKVVFGQTVRAADKVTFSWDTATEAQFARGPLAGVGSYTTSLTGTLFDTDRLFDPALPTASTGLYYLFAPDCDGRSYQNQLGDETGRDAALVP